MRKLRLLYSFPHRIGAGRICDTAYEQVKALTKKNIDVTLFTASVAREVPAKAKTVKTLSIGKFRLPVRLLGRNKTCALHDYIVSKWIEKHHDEIDVIHCWPLGSIRTIRTANRFNIPTLMERPNAHTQFAFQRVEDESKKLGIALPKEHDHAFNNETLEIENAEYNEATFLLCPSEFVKKTFLDKNFKESKILRHRYGCDLDIFSPSKNQPESRGLKAIYVGACEPRKGLHYALEAWKKSDASRDGELLICGKFVPEYEEKVRSLIDQPNVKYLGQRSDIGELMKNSDVFLLPSVEEGSALVTYEARASGCVLLVSDSCGAVCEHEHDGIIHDSGESDSITTYLNLLQNDQALLQKLRHNSLEERHTLSWDYGVDMLFNCYHEACSTK
ncbi:glycosyltransferase family 4 protein [Puniceicoccaceae bacterium K14]|nr:glycosyltransferase family 4 protein [Puniceicoccaceae bacterium K14]